MKTKAVRIYGKNDLRLEEFDLPPMQDDEILDRKMLYPIVYAYLPTKLLFRGKNTSVCQVMCVKTQLLLDMSFAVRLSR
jgi:hypothetical protein